MTESNNSEKTSAVTIIIRTLVSLAVLVVIVYLAKTYLKDEIVYLGTGMIDRYGMTGLFASIYFVDTFIVPATPDIFLGLLVASKNANQFFGLAVICIASVLAGFSGYFIGTKLMSWPWLRKLTASYEEKGSNLIFRYGTTGVIIAALTPIPFSTVCWLAGMFKMNLKKFSFAALFRIPRMIIYYFIIAWAWI